MSLGDWYLTLFAIGSGVSIAAFWAFVALTGRLDRLSGGRPDFGSHIAAEMVTAALLIAGGLGIALETSWASILTALGLGALLYALVEVPGHYFKTGNRALALAALASWPFAIAAIVVLLV